MCVCVCLGTDWNPNMNRKTGSIFITCIASSALTFYLFAFQVHEKSILFPLLFISCLLYEFPTLVMIFGYVASFSMYPLLERDGLIIPYMLTQFLYLWGVPLLYKHAQISYNALAFYTTGLLGVIIHGIVLYLPQIMPSELMERLPHLGPLLFAASSFVCFSLTWLYLNFYLCYHGLCSKLDQEKKNQ